MKFYVSKSSNHCCFKNSPCKKAYKTMRPVYENRTCTEDYFNSNFSKREGLWRDRGTEHRIPKEGFIQRRLADEEAWTIDIDSLEDLMEFIKDNDRIIVTEDEIEIYDGYGE